MTSDRRDLHSAKILVTGARGQLGSDVCKVLCARHVENRGVGRKDFDIADAEAARAYIKEYRPDAVIHCAAWTAVDEAEDEPDKVLAVNAFGTRNIAAACKEIGAKMLYISTDYVFPGTGERPYEPDDPADPLNAYGKSKFAGEQAVREILDRYFIVRISWIFGKSGDNFVKTMLRLSQTRRELAVVCDQVGSPTYTADLALLLCDMVMTEKYGIYHAGNEGFCTRAAFAEEIFRRSGRDVLVHPIPTSEYPTKAARPLNSRMSKEKIAQMGFSRLPSWQDALERYLREIGEI